MLHDPPPLPPRTRAVGLLGLRAVLRKVPPRHRRCVSLVKISSPLLTFAFLWLFASTWTPGAQCTCGSGITFT